MSGWRRLWLLMSIFIGGITCSIGYGVYSNAPRGAGIYLTKIKSGLQTTPLRYNSPASVASLKANARALGASGGGVTDDRSFIQGGIDKLNAAGGGTLFLPRGTYLIGSPGIVLKSNVSIVGEGPGTILKLAKAANAHVIAIATQSNVAVRNLTIDGNRANQSAAAHGIRGAEVTGLTVDNLLIRQTSGYGIGLQRGTIKTVKLSDLVIEDTGSDGIDFKNTDDDNEDIQLNNVTVRRWGLSGATTEQAALDFRGPVKANKIWVSEPIQRDASGVRFRTGEVGDASGLGGHRSSLSTFRIQMGAGAAQLGLDVPARDVTVSNGYVAGGFRGVQVLDEGFRGTNLTVEGASGDGFLLAAAGGGLDAHGATLLACKSIGNGSDGIEIRSDDARLTDFVATGNTGYGARVQATARGTVFTGARLTGNAAGEISDRATTRRRRPEHL